MQGDALELLSTLETGSVDCVCTDPPYGTTKAPWDVAPDWKMLFDLLWRVLKPNGALLMFSQNPLAAELICMQRRWFRYEWVWEKKCAAGFLNSNKMPMRAHELVLVFYKSQPPYNAALIESQRGKQLGVVAHTGRSELYGSQKTTYTPTRSDGYRCPRDVILCGRDKVKYHTTQKPVELLRALLSQYCCAGDVVLDPFMGSGSTLVAARELGLRGVGFELSEQYFEIAKARIEGR